MSDELYMSREPMLEMFIFETNQLLEQLEEMLMASEKENSISAGNINEIFRIMHTIKGSSAMMMFNNISSIAHAVEDLFYYIREKKPDHVNYSHVCDLVLAASDFIKGEIGKIEAGEDADGEEKVLPEKIKAFLANLKGEADGDTGETSQSMAGNETQKFYISSYGKNLENPLKKFIAKVRFEDGCQMENIRAFTIVHNLKEICADLYHEPPNILDDNTSCEYIVQNGFQIFFSSATGEDEIRKVFDESIFISTYELAVVEDFQTEMAALQEEVVVVDDQDDLPVLSEEAVAGNKEIGKSNARALKQSLINVNVQKLDTLMDLVGEIVITESMVTRNPDLAGLHLENFSKAVRQLRKLTDELQDIVMSIRMMPIAATFHKMHRIVRDMGKQLEKDADLIILGEETEVDKNIIDQLSDPLMHLIRNSMDHGLESTAERMRIGKPTKGKITLEAKNAGGDVWITVKDDGRGLDKHKILDKARIQGLFSKPETDYTDKEIYNFILLAGFSTKEQVSEFSGRGVGMDVVRENIQKVGGTMTIDSNFGFGTTISVKIPLTLAIIDGMHISVGESSYIIPTNAIRESFRADDNQVIEDAEGNEMMMIRGQCYPVIRIHRRFGVVPRMTELRRGIIIVAEGDDRTICLFADELLGEQQVVVKPIPAYIRKAKGLTGCTILGDGSISLILDVNGMEP